ncbi:MAG: nucleotidyl transferase AbiEii/AbiGii toxin family protein [Paracoccaceae bacterium]|nr:nucleotidyl transferase AbiEii/AbiGii toxin family protein [Paracoccaceae bacterium]
MAMSIIDKANANGIGLHHWSFGGGTALMLQIRHRESHDIDLFIEDAQYLPFLNPQTQDYQLALNPTDYETDGSHALKIVFDGVGEVDFICCGTITATPVIETYLRGRRIRVETPAEILAKKVVFRGTRMQPRDMFDIAASARAIGEGAVIKALGAFPEACKAAAQTVARMDPDFAKAVMASLLAMDGFRSLHADAQDITLRILLHATSGAST